MSKRIDYLEDPAAPAANSIVPSANVIVVNSQDEILFIRRSDNGNYAIPGGGMDIGESLTDTAIRECLEETGYEIDVDGLVGIFTNPRHVLHYTSNNEVRQEFSVVYHGHIVGGGPEANNEATEIVWVPRSDLAGLAPMDPTMRYRLHVFTSGQAPHIDRPGDMAQFLASLSE